MKNIFIYGLLLVLISCTESGLNFESVSGSSIPSKNGSYSRMLVVKNRLYGVSNSEISTLDISDKKNPVLLDKKKLGFSIESIFHHDNILYVGSSQQMYILKLDARLVPVLESSTQYFSDDVNGCDPIVVDKNTAFVTLSPSSATNEVTQCSRRILGFPLQIGQLRVYDVTNIKSPVQKAVIDVEDPKGLAVSGNYLYVCNSEKGLNVYSLEKNIYQPELVHTTEPFLAFDVIVNKGIVIVVGGKNLHQYEHKHENGKVILKKLSTIEL